MPTKASDVALAEVRALIQDRTRWPGEVLIGAGANWLREGAMAAMSKRRLDTDEAVAGARSAILPIGLLDAIEINDQVNAYVSTKADELRMLGQNGAAMALAAENFAPDTDPSVAETLKQFHELVAARVSKERPQPPPWLGRAWTAAEIEAVFAMSDEALDELGAIGLDELLERIEDALADTDTRTAWLRAHAYSPAPVGAYDVDPPGAGILWATVQAATALHRVHSSATQALGRAELPDEWTDVEVSRRLFRQLAIRKPVLASDMMTRRPVVKLLDR